jgi:ATP synthase protein I
MAARDENAAFSIIGYLLSGLLFWGGVGLGLDKWLGTSFLLLSGLLVGAGSGIYLVWLRFGRE